MLSLSSSLEMRRGVKRLLPTAFLNNREERKVQERSCYIKMVHNVFHIAIGIYKLHLLGNLGSSVGISRLKETLKIIRVF